MAITENLSLTDHATNKDRLEYRSSNGAWYDVDLSRHGDRLIIQYRLLFEIFNEVYEPGKFETVEEVNKFRDRFRPSSVQVQDNECRQVFPGLKVCASYSFTDDDPCCYDAMIDEVHYKEHSFTDGEEQCWCSFTLTWQDGPHTGKSTTIRLESLCFLQDGALDLTLVDFIRMCRVEVMSSLNHAAPFVGDGSTQGAEFALNHPLNAYQQLKDPEHAKRAAKGNLNIQCRYPFVLAIGNLEKDISTSSITDFIHKETEISIEAHIFPSMETDLFTWGILKVRKVREFNKLLEFIESPYQIVASSRNRPWVVTERFVLQDKSPVENTMPIMDYGNGMGGKSEFKILYPGTDEYTLAKEYKENFTEFNRDLKRLLTRLAFEEEKIQRQCGKTSKRSRK